MKRKYRLERCGLSGVKEVTDRLTALGGQGWCVVSTSHHGAELFVLLELVIDTSHQEEAEPNRKPGRPKKPLDAISIPSTVSVGKILTTDISTDGTVEVTFS